MKTKIIYISGQEAFAPTDVQVAFDEVRNLLNLGKDTIIFGVPIDSDDLNILNASPAAEKIAPDIIYVSQVEPQPIQKKKTIKKTATRTAASTGKADESAPILSVMAPVQNEPEPIVQNEEPEIIEEAKPEISADIVITQEKIVTDEEVISISTASMDLNSAPIENRVQTIEDILSELTPLQEEKPIDLSMSDSDMPALDDIQNSERMDVDKDYEATLSKMAEEFLDSEGTALSQKPAKSGKISKLKNILPFKKNKKEDTSMLGDLFGWAGIAANDDDEKFSMPDFFRANS